MSRCPLLKVLYLKTYQSGRLGHLGGRLRLLHCYTSRITLITTWTQLLELVMDVCMVKESP